MWKLRRAPTAAPAPAEPLRQIATAEETAARLSTLTVPERELLEWGKQQEPMTISFCSRGPYVVGVDHSLDLFNLQQHIEQCVEPLDDESGTPPEMCTHLGTGTSASASKIAAVQSSTSTSVVMTEAVIRRLSQTRAAATDSCTAESVCFPIIVKASNLPIPISILT